MQPCCLSSRRLSYWNFVFNKKRIFVRCDVIAKRTNDYFRVCFICKKSMTGVSISARYSGMVKSFADVLPAMSYFRLKEGEHKLGV